MTALEILFHLTELPSENVAAALSNTREVYGIRHLAFDRAALTLRVEYDASRLNAAAVTKLVRQAGVQIAAKLPLVSA
ncbi:MAG TPA: hypothetical protein VGF01_20705 [Terracidiphilus sp.]|jgi:hypothetical protein